MKKQQIRLICFSGLLAALVLVLTAFVHIPVHTGYVHVGDAFIYLGACLLPMPYAPLAGMLGNLLQSAASGIIFIVLAAAADKLKLKSKLLETN